MNKVLKISIVVVICLIVILAATLLISQCSNNGNSDKTTTTTTPTTTTTSSSTTGSQGGDPDCTEHVDANTDYICDICNEQLEKPNDGFTATNDKVYVITSQLNIRKLPDAEGNPIASALMDDELTRLGYYENGWSKIVYDGEECYVKTDCLTTQSPITDADFTDIEETVYLTRNEKVYSKPSLISAHQYSEEMDTLFAEKSVIRLGVATKVYTADNGTEITFAKVKYTNADGQEVVWYIDNTALTTEAPANPDGDVVFMPNNDVLISIVEQSFWLRKSTNYVDSEVAVPISAGTVLQAIARGVEESDGTIWYKVIYEDDVYYAIYKPEYFDIQMPEEFFNELTLTLPETFKYYGFDGMQYFLANENTAISIVNSGELPENITLEAFADLVIIKSGLDNVSVQTKDEILFFEFESTIEVEGQSYTSYCITVFIPGANNSIHTVIFDTEGTKDNSFDTLWGYIAAIELK